MKRYSCRIRSRWWGTERYWKTFGGSSCFPERILLYMAMKNYSAISEFILLGLSLLNVYMTFSLSINLWWTLTMSWLLWIMWQWILECTYFFKRNFRKETPSLSARPGILGRLVYGDLEQAGWWEYVGWPCAFCWICGQVNQGLGSVGMLALSLSHGRTCGSRISFFAVLCAEFREVWHRWSYFLPFQMCLSHFCVPSGCCNLSPGFQIFHKGIFIHGWLFNWCFFKGIRAGTSYSSILLTSIILFFKDCYENL